MNLRFILSIGCLLLLTIFSGCKNTNDQINNNVKAIATASVTPASPLPKEEHLLTLTYTSKLLSKSVDGNKPTKELTIYLPPSYYNSNKRFPVVYYFHGFGEKPIYVSNKYTSFIRCMQDEPKKEFIIVEVDGRTLGSCGSFYVNSTVTGEWEDYVIDEIVPYIDKNYRTIAAAESRGAAGFSMGGFAAINLAFLHPDIFSSVQALCPGLLKDDELDLAMQTWSNDTSFKRSYGQAFAPNLKAKYLCDIPSMDDSKEDTVICEKWLDGFGHLDKKIENYLSLNKPLNKLQILYGTMDYYSWIPNGTKHFSVLLKDKGIEHTLIELSGGHEIPSTYVEEYFMPFFSDSLQFNE